jgi:hypothetical protein
MAGRYAGETTKRPKEDAFNTKKDLMRLVIHTYNQVHNYGLPEQQLSRAPPIHDTNTIAINCQLIINCNNY